MVQLLPEQPTFLGQLGTGLGAGLGAGTEQLLQGLTQRRQQALEAQQNQQTIEQLKQRGIPDRIAELYPFLTEGGKTKAAELGLEEAQRNEMFEQQDQGLQPSERNQEFINDTVAKNFKGRTGRERIKREDELFKQNEPKIQEAQKKLSTLGTEKLRIDRLEQLNQTDELPEGLARLNVNFETGELRVPFLGSAGAQEFVKIINDFTTGAKDTFGARVTNFELNRFLRRLPSLLNTQEGRERVLRQMSILNEINTLHNQSVDDIFERYGMDKLSFSQASKLAERINKHRVDDLKKEYVGLDKAPRQKEEITEEKTVIMVDPEGRRRRVPQNQSRKAQEAGYRLER